MENIVYNIDCMEYMKTIPDKAFDLAIVDPPYSIDAVMGNKNNGRKARFSQGAGKLKNRFLNKADLGWDVAPTQEYFDELFRISKNQIIWGGNYFNLPPTRGIVCWDKKQPWENFSQWEMAWTSFDKPAKMFRLSATARTKEDVKIHPTQKPVRLYEWLLTKFTERERERVIDTHVGSGSSRIACAKLGFDFVGCEIDKAYWELQEKRFAEWSSQLRLDF